MEMKLSNNDLRVMYEVLNFVISFKDIAKAFEGDDMNLEEINNRLTAHLGDPVELLQRADIIRGIKQAYKDDPKRIKKCLNQIEKDYPLPPALR